MPMINGINISQSPLVKDVAKLKLSDEVMVTDDFRMRFNDWLEEMFGTTPTILVLDKRLFVSPLTMRQLKQQIHHYQFNALDKNNSPA